MTQSVQREKLETQVQRKLAVNSEKNASIRHSNVMTIETLTNKINPFSSGKSATNRHNIHSNVMNINTLRTEDCFTESDSAKKTAAEINVSTLCDSHMKNRRKNSCGNISSISNSDVEMTWRSQRVMSEQRNHQQVGVLHRKKKMLTFGCTPYSPHCLSPP